MNLNTITQYTSPVVFKKINTTSPITNITKDTSTSPIQIIQYNQNFEPVSVNLENTHNYKNETNYEKSAPRQSINYDREIIPPSTDEISKTTNIKIIKKMVANIYPTTYHTITIITQIAHFFRIVNTPPILKLK